MTKPEDWVYASMDALVNEHNLKLNPNQYEALVHVMSVLGAGPFKKTKLMKRLIAGDTAAAKAEILRLAGNREGLERTILETAAELFGKKPYPPPQPDDPGAPQPPPSNDPAPLMFWFVVGMVAIVGVLLLFL